MKKRYVFLGTIAFPLLVFGQEQTIDTVKITDRRLYSFEETKQFQRISKEKITNTAGAPSQLLQFYTLAAVRENGRGAAASLSFRGTSAAQTAVLWNGISINSLTLGQADINTIAVQNADEMHVIAGGGSLEYGSGVMGGSVHLLNTLQYDKGFHFGIRQEIGSFSTVNHHGSAEYSTEKVAVKAAVFRSASANDFSVPTRNFRSMNAAYMQNGWQLSTGFRPNKNHHLSWISNYQNNRQQFPIFSVNQFRSAYETWGQKNLLHYEYGTPQASLNSSVKVAHLLDYFAYIASLDSPLKTVTGTSVWDVKGEINIKAHPAVTLSLYPEYRTEKIIESTNLPTAIQRTIYSTLFTAQWRPLRAWLLEASTKKIWTDEQNPPLLFSAGFKGQPTSFLTLKGNFSTNYRLPSFNDMYWPQGGNPDLFPETGYHTDASVTVHHKKFAISLTPFFLKIKNNIRWMPTSKGYWKPFNLTTLQSKGVESAIQYSTSIQRLHLDVRAAHAFTIAINEDTQQAVPYAPRHKITWEAAFSLRDWKLLWNGMYQSRTFTTTDDEQEYGVPTYHVMNLSLSKKIRQAEVGAKVLNVENFLYLTSPYYYQPPRSFSLWVQFSL